MPSFPLSRVSQNMEMNSHQGRNVLVGLPFHHNLTFQQLFDTCGVSLAVIEQSLYSTSHQVLQRRINNVSLTLNNVSLEFHQKVPDEVSYLLLLILQKLYEILQIYIEKESVPFPKHFEAVQQEGPTGLLGIPHGQVHVSLEKLVAKLTVTDDESERIEEFVYQVHRRIGRSTKNTSALEKTVLGAEMWAAYLKALSAYTHPEHATKITSAVQEDLDEIKRLLEMKELGLSRSSPIPESTRPGKSDTYLWQDFHSGGDGAGKVYKIRIKDPITWKGEYYACKVIRQSRGSALPDVTAEYEILSIVSSGHHPNIVEVIDTWLEQNSYFTTCYIQMELCEGDLHDFLQKRYSRGNPLSRNEIWDTFRQMMNGVEYIHLQDIVHGDLKPKNILYKHDNKGGLVWKITDFGVSSRKYFPPLTFGRMTRNYCAPELLIASRYTKKMDIWSAGCILYELATGHPLFLSDEDIRKYAWSGTSIPQISGFRGDLSSADEFVGRMLNISMEMRPEASSILRDIPKEKTIDENSDFPIARHAIQKIQGYEDLGGNRYLARMDGRHELVIVESHHIVQHSTHLNDDIRKLVHVLRSLYDIPQCHIPRCLGFMNATHDHYSLVYSNPTPLIPQEWDCYTLEHVLSTPRCTAHQELFNPLLKVELALALARTLEQIHVAGYTHQSLGAHNVLYQPNAPSLMGFNLQILQSIQTPQRSTIEWRERLYQHPQIRTTEVTIYKPEYDYYALGVILLEIGRMESFANARGSLKREDENLHPERLQGFRIARAKELNYVADKYADVVMKCLVADFGEGDKSDVIQTFREEVCDVLEGIESSLKGLRLRVVGV